MCTGTKGSIQPVYHTDYPQIPKNGERISSRYLSIVSFWHEYTHAVPVIQTIVRSFDLTHTSKSVSHGVTESSGTVENMKFGRRDLQILVYRWRDLPYANKEHNRKNSGTGYYWSDRRRREKSVMLAVRG